MHILFASCILQGWSQQSVESFGPRQGRSPLLSAKCAGRMNPFRPTSTTVQQRGLKTARPNPMSTTVHRVADGSQTSLFQCSRERSHPWPLLRRMPKVHDGLKRAGSAWMSERTGTHRASGMVAIAPRTRSSIDCDRFAGANPFNGQDHTILSTTLTERYWAHKCPCGGFCK